jgi:hypothetical protein
VTEQAHPEVLVQEQAEVQEWVDLVGEEWAAPEPVQVRLENALVLNVERVSPMKPEYPVTTKAVQNVVQRWYEDNSQF